MRIPGYIFLFLSFHVFAQQSFTDSLLSIYKNKTKPDSVRLSALNIAAFEYAESKSDTSLLLAEELKTLGEKTGFERYVGLAYRTMGLAWDTKGDADKGLDNYFSAIKIFSENRNTSGLINVYLYVGHNYRMRYNYPKALEYYLKGLDLCKETGNINYENVFCFQVGIVYSTQEKFAEALKYHTRSLELATKSSNEDQMANCNIMIASDYLYLKKLNQALEHYSKAMEYYRRINYLQAEASCYSGMGKIYLEQGNFEKALNSYKKGLEIAKKGKLSWSVGESFQDLAYLNNAAGKYRLALLYSDSAQEIAKISENDLVNMSAICEIRASAFSKLGLYKEAYQNYVLYKALDDSIAKKSKGQSISEVIARLENEKKDLEREKQKELERAEAKRSRFIILGTALMLLIVIVFSLLLYRRFRVTSLQKGIIESKNKELEEKNKEITDSIRYAKRIQMAQIPSEKMVQKNLTRIRT